MSSSGDINALSLSARNREQSGVATRPRSSSEVGGEPTGGVPGDTAFLIASKLRARFGERPYVLVVTSVTRGEGVSTAVGELARVLALSKKDESVLIVDANLHDPSQHDAFAVAGSPGLVELTSGEVDVNDAIRATACPRLFVLPAGRPVATPMRRFDAAGYGRVVAALRSHFHTILVNAPAMADRDLTPSIASHSDGVLMVVAPGRHDRRRVRMSVIELSGLGVDVVGTCLSSRHEPRGWGWVSRLSALARGFLGFRFTEKEKSRQERSFIV